MNPKVYYASPKTPAEKVRFLIKIAADQFAKSQKLIIFTQDSKTAEFVDNLLWSEPKEGFLPHFISQTLLDECIVITSEKTNLNQAKLALNLSLEPLNPSDLKLANILEIEDKSSPERLNFFKKKIQFYQKMGIPIVAL